MATVNAASLREEFEAAKTRITALRAAGKVPKEAVIRVLVILLDIIIVVLLEKTTHEPELRSAAVTDGQGRERAGSNGKGPKPNRQMGDNLRKIIVEETVAACDACGADGVDPVDRERRTTSCSRSSSAAPRSRNARSARPGAGSPTTSRAVRHRHQGPRHQPAGRPDAVPAPCRRVRAGDLRHQALRGNLPRLCFHDASWEEAAVAHSSWRRWRMYLTFISGTLPGTRCWCAWMKPAGSRRRKPPVLRSAGGGQL